MKVTHEFFSLLDHAFISLDVRALNSTIFVHSTLNSIFGMEYHI